jgi:hypothetical protein
VYFDFFISVEKHHRAFVVEQLLLASGTSVHDVDMILFSISKKILLSRETHAHTINHCVHPVTQECESNAGIFIKKTLNFVQIYDCFE